ncbi:MAG: metal-dependent transcriptional regulator [Bifidobacteriaceae bacterium]|jgi:DtxR family Mn-dependent transcriptional regulator|nr:metal-dependent transcriptional regulator [Bifidobacteriaceae bacterium]
MTDLIDTTEMYLRTIYELEEEGIVPLRARIAERIGHSGPTVSQTVARMERDGLVKVRDDRHLELTPVGRTRATQVMRKHRLAERLLTDVIGLDWEYVHDEACRWEHVMSEAVERRLVEVLDRPQLSPYGTPIPGLDELGVDRLEVGFLDGVHRLDDAVPPSGPDPSPVAVKVARLGESLQTDAELLTRFAAAEALPGRSVEAWANPSATVWFMRRAGNGIVLELPSDLAVHVFVARER